MEIWHNLEIREIFKILRTSEKGMKEEEAKKRLKKYGLNKLPEEKPLSRFYIFLSQFKSPLVYILLVAALITFFLKDFIDTFVILGTVFLNTLVGFFQEDKANKAISKLKKLIEYKAKVIREGRERLIDIKELVPGDLTLLEAGDRVPTDARLIESLHLQVNEASLTGESLPLSKSLKILEKSVPLVDRENMVYLGTSIVRGKGKAIVVETGLKTELGKIAFLVHEVKEEKTPLQKQLAKFARTLTIILSFICLIILIIGLFQGRNFVEMLTTSVAVAVAAIPEGLLVTVTIILAIGMQRILKEKALVRKLIATETLGSVSVIASDKTGTLTEGEMKVWQILAEDKNLALKIALLCNNTFIENPEAKLEEFKIIGDPTEKALLLKGIEEGLNKEKLEIEEPKIDEIPFEETGKFMATLHKAQRLELRAQSFIIYVKGAPEKILEISSFVDEQELTKEKKEELKKEFEDLTKKGLRVLAVAYKETSNPEFRTEEVKDLNFVGFFALKDPLRKEAKETIELCRKAGIKPIIVTGDHKLTAKAIAEELGLPAKEENILEGEELEKMEEEKFKKIVEKIEIYARVEPKHKLKIIDALQEKNEVVAMTGDGVNDAPALKSADIGIALGSGTDVAKETSDIILLDNNFRTIVKAIEQGRVIFENIKKVVLYLLSSSFTEIILVVGSLFLNFPLPILAAQILWVNLIQDSLPALALAFDPEEKEVMKDKPRRKEEPMLNLKMKILIFIIGIITDLVLLTLFYYLYTKTRDLTYIRTFIFSALAIDSLFYVFSCRSLRKNIWQINPFENKFLNLTVLFGFLMLFLSLYLKPFQIILRTIPLGLKEWLILIGIGVFNLFAIEFGKLIFIKRDTNILIHT